MPIAVVRLGSPRRPGEGLRVGTVRRPPRGVPKADFAKRYFYEQTNFSIGCYCENEERCHRSVLRELLAERGAAFS